jgi:hypothetical protein
LILYVDVVGDYKLISPVFDPPQPLADASKRALSRMGLLSGFWPELLSHFEPQLVLRILMYCGFQLFEKALILRL